MMSAKNIVLASMIIAMFALASAPALAVDYCWNVADGNWGVASNWTPSGPPTSSDIAYIDNGGTAYISTEVEAGNLYTGYSNSGTVEQTDGSNTVGNLYFGYEATDSVGTYNISGGDLNVLGTARLGYGWYGGGYNVGGQGVLNISGGTSLFGKLEIDSGSHVTLSAGDISVDNVDLGSIYEMGVFYQTGGTNTIHGDLAFGYLGSQYNLSDGALFVGCITTNYLGSYGVFNQTGGTNTVDKISFGVDEGCYDVYNLSGGYLSSNIERYGARNGHGSFNQTGGIHVVGNMEIGLEWGSGSYSLSAGELSVSSHEYIGHYGGGGVFNQTGGTHTIGGSLRLAESSNSSGTYNLSAGELSALQYEYVGDSGMGEFNQTGGIHTIASGLFVGYFSAPGGTYNLSGTGELSAGFEYIGYVYGTGVFNQTGGTHAVDGYLYIGYEIGYEDEASGEYNFSGGSLAMGNLDINNGWMDIDLDEIDFFRVDGDKVELLDGYILDGKIFDSTMGANGWFYAVYDSENDWTTLEAVPEPGTVAMIAMGAISMLGVIRKRFK